MTQHVTRPTILHNYCDGTQTKGQLLPDFDDSPFAFELPTKEIVFFVTI